MKAINRRFIFHVIAMLVVGILAFIASQFLVDSIINSSIDRATINLVIIGIIISSLGVTVAIAYQSKKIQNSLLKTRKHKEIQSDELLIKNETLENFSTVLGSINQAVAIINRKDEITWVNESFERMFGFTKIETLGNKVSSLLAGPETDIEQIKKMDEAIFVKKEPIIVKVLHYRKDRSLFMARVNITPLIDENGELENYIAVSSDITEEHEIELKLATSESNFKDIARTVEDVLYLYNIKNNKYEFISDHCESTLGAPPEFFYSGQSHTDKFAHEDDREILHKSKEKINNGIPYDIEYRLNIDDKVKWIHEKSFPIKDENGKMIRNSGVCTDITALKLKNFEIEQKNKEIQSSINYAQRIQLSTLPTNDHIVNLLPKSFVLYKPKDIVSGDFYRFDQIKTNDGKSLVGFMVGDCTGHGIPGATLAILCCSLIKQSLSEDNVHSASEALDWVRSNLQNLFFGIDDRSKMYEGMDAGFGVLDEENMKLYYSGAFIDCTIVRSDKIITIKGNRQHVGYTDDPKPFTLHQFQLEKGDCIYITSDGYIDQFGEITNRKFMMKKFHETIIKTSKLPLNERRNHLLTVFETWKGKQEQVDDICVIGVEV